MKVWQSKPDRRNGSMYKEFQQNGSHCYLIFSLLSMSLTDLWLVEKTHCLLKKARMDIARTGQGCTMATNHEGELLEES